jgi:RND family efflux transporter MFP subunit
MKSKKKWGVVVLVAAVAALTIFLYVASKQKGGSAEPDYAGNEIQFEVTKEDIGKSVEVKGKSSYVNQTAVYAPFTADVDIWHMDEGQNIQAGDVLFELIGERLRQELSLAEVRVLQQQLDLRLLDASSVLSSELLAEPDSAPLNRFAKKEQEELSKKLKQAELQLAQADIKDKQQRLANQRLIAPEAGIFLFAEGKKPDRVEQDQLIGYIVDISELELITEVSEHEVFRIKEGMEVEVKIDAWGNEKIIGHVEKVAKFAKAKSNQNASSSAAALFEIRISLETQPDLIAGLSLTGKITTDSRQGAIVVPTIAVLRDNDQYYVYTYGDDGIVRRDIQIGIETSDKTEVLEGLSEGEVVVLR